MSRRHPGPYDVDYLTYPSRNLPFLGWRPSRIFISDEEALRRMPEADVSDPKLMVVDDPAWEIAKLRAEQLEREGRLLEATNLRTRAICAKLS